MDSSIFSADSPLPPSVPGRLLAALLSAGSLVQPEPVLTRAVRFLLGLPGTHGALDDLVRRGGVEPQPDGYWLTEVVHTDGGRTDLEYWCGSDPQPRVIVEAKIGHALEASQLDGYRSRLNDDGGLLVVLLPKTRAREGEAVVDQLRARYVTAGAPAVRLWTWDEVADHLETALPDSPDVAQLRGLIETAGALDVLPFTESELDVADASRVDDLWKVLNRASNGLFDQYLSMQHGGPFERWRRVSVGGFDSAYKVGIGRRHRGEHESWIWASVSRASGFGRAAQEALLARYPDARRDSEEVAVPIALVAGRSGVELAEDIREQLYEIATVIREAIAAGLALAHESNAGRAVEAPNELVGIPPFTADDLLDTSARRDDIVTLVRAVLRHVLEGGRPIRFDLNEPFADRAWIGLDPFKTHISLGIERTDASDCARPWAWLSVHQVTPSSVVAYEVLDELFPDDAVDIPNGHGVPVNIPPGSTGVEAFHSVVAQAEETMTAIRKQLIANSPS